MQEAELKGWIEEGFRGIAAEFKSVREEIGGLRDELREEIGGLRDEMREEIGGLRGEMRSEIGGVRDELRAEIAGFRAETDARFATLENSVLKIGIQYEHILSTLRFLQEGESLDLADRFRKLESRVTILERKRRG